MKKDGIPKVQDDSDLGASVKVRGFWWIIAGFLVVQAVLAIDSAQQWSPTHDEYWHLPIGLRIWKTARFDEDVINPPLVRLWAAFPLLFGGAATGDISMTHEVGEIGDRFWNANGDRSRFWFFLGRLMIIPSATVAGLIIAVWSRAWFGELAATISVLLWASCPTALANATIVTHDAPLATAWLATLFLLARFAEDPSWKRSLQFGAALGIAMLTKLTAIVLFPLCILLWFVIRFKSQRVSAVGISSGGQSIAAPVIPATALRLLGQWIVAMGLALVIINACYLFRGCGNSLGALSFASPQMNSIQKFLWFLSGMPVPLPTDFIAAFDRLAQDLERVHPIYLESTWSNQPFTLYYAAALFYKLPISTLGLILISLAAVYYPLPDSQDRRHGLFLLIAALALPVLASRSANQIGIRYILPTLPLLCIFAGQASRWMYLPEFPTRLGLLAGRVVWILAILAPFSLRFHPHHLAYFNEMAGGPINGTWHLLDSNIDWGQDLYGLKDYIDQHQIEDLGLAYFGTVLPTSVGIFAHDPPVKSPEPGWYAISVNYVNGRPHQFRNRAGGTIQVGMGEFKYFRYFEPVDTIGYSINVYHLTFQDIEQYNYAKRNSQRSQ